MNTIKKNTIASKPSVSLTPSFVYDGRGVDKVTEILSPLVSVPLIASLPAKDGKLSEDILGLNDAEFAEAIESFRSSGASAMRKAAFTVYIASLKGTESLAGVCKIYGERYSVQSMRQLKQVATSIIPFCLENQLEYNDVCGLRNVSKLLLNDKPATKAEKEGRKEILEAVKAGKGANALQAINRKASGRDVKRKVKGALVEVDLSDDAKALTKTIEAAAAQLARKTSDKDAVVVLLKAAASHGYRPTK